MKLQIVFATGNSNKIREIREILQDPSITVMSMKQLGIHSDPEETGTTFQENALIKARACAEEILKNPAVFSAKASSGRNNTPAATRISPSAATIADSDRLGFAAVAHLDPSTAAIADSGHSELSAAAHLDPSVPVAVLSDDSGLAVDALGGAPGIYSARYMGRDTSYTLKMQHIMDELSDVKGKDRSARFVCACAAVFPKKDIAIMPNTSSTSTSDTISGSNDPDNINNFEEIVVTGTMEGEIAYEIRGENGFGYDPFFWLPEYGKTSAELTDEEKNAISHRGKAFRAMIAELGERFSF